MVLVSGFQPEPPSSFDLMVVCSRNYCATLLRLADMEDQAVANRSSFDICGAIPGPRFTNVAILIFITVDLTRTAHRDVDYCSRGTYTDDIALTTINQQYTRTDR